MSEKFQNFCKNYIIQNANSSNNLSVTARSEKNQSAYMLKLHLFVRLHFTIGARGTKNYPLLQKNRLL